MVLNQLNPQIDKAVRLAEEIYQLWSKISFKLHNIGLEIPPSRIYIGSTPTFKIYVEGFTIRFTPRDDFETIYYEMDLTTGGCYEKTEEDTQTHINCIPLIGLLYEMDKKALEHTIEKLEKLKISLEHFLSELENNP